MADSFHVRTPYVAISHAYTLRYSTAVSSMTESIVVAALVMGLFSTLHCVGMCGGIMGVLTSSLGAEIRTQRPVFFGYVALLIMGRLLSYMGAGLLVGTLGEGLFALLGEPAAVNGVRLIAALMMVMVGLYIAGWFPRFAAVERIGLPIWRWLEPLGRRLLPVSSPQQALGYGLVWGWLPCGMVYAALIMALSAGGAVDSALVMGAFGLGTIPAMMGVALFTQRLLLLSRQPRVRQWAGGVLIVLAAGMVWSGQLHLALAW